MELLPQYQRDPAALSLLYVRVRDRQARPARARWPSSTRTVGPLTVQPSRPAARRDVSFNLAPGVSLGEAVGRDRGRWSASCSLPATLSTSFQGTAQAFQSLAAGAGPAAPGRRSRHLPGARDPLRELHPPDHDPLRAAVGGLRRAAHAHRSSTGAEHLRLRRHHHADRHREEERHHDDRLRPRGAAQGRQARRRRDLRGAASSASARS